MSKKQHLQISLLLICLYAIAALLLFQSNLALLVALCAMGLLEIANIVVYIKTNKEMTQKDKKDSKRSVWAIGFALAFIVYRMLGDF